MTKTLKELQEEHPEWCFTCGKYWLEPGGVHTCHESPLMAILTAAKREDEKNIIIRELEAKLSAEREAHAATKEELWEAQETVQQQAWELREVDQAALARQSQRAALKGESHE